jgi:hypothetical protein
MDLINFTIEELASALYLKCEERGIYKGTDKTKWREAVVADKLGFVTHAKISAGKGKDEYGSDAFESDGKAAEFKSKALDESDLNNLFQSPYGNKGKKYAPLKVSGVYNGYNSNYETASVAYAEINHYFSLFYKEECVMIIKVNTDYVMKCLNENYDKFVAKGRKGSTNLNSVIVSLGDTDNYTVVYKNESFFNN